MGAAVFVLVVGAASMVLTLQGWRARAPAFDLLPHIENAYRLVHSGTLPKHGDTGSYGSYKPPGTAWVMAPSIALFGEPRLSEHVGAGLLHGLTLAGLFWLGWYHFGAGCAYLSVALYALSEHGVFLAGSLWPNGRPDIFVALVAFATLWVSRRDARFLALAAATWGIGMYIDMGVTPAFFIFPVIWAYERPPVRIAPLTIAAAIVLLVWSPYLLFEAPRGFADIRSQLLQQDIFPSDYRQVWCDPSLVLRAAHRDPTLEGVGPADEQQSADRRVLQAGVAAGRAAVENAISNFNVVAPIPGAPFVMFVLAVAGLFTSGVSGGPLPPVTDAGSAARRRRRVAAVIVVTVLGLFYVGTSSFVLGHHEFAGLSAIRRFSKLSVAAMALGIVLPAITEFSNRLAARRGVAPSSGDAAARTRVLRISLIVPWTILIIVAESGKPERFWWLWPLQMLFVSAFVLAILPRLGVPRVMSRIVAVGVVGLVVANGLLISRAHAWATSGWTGPDAEEVQIVDRLAAHILAEGRTQAAIGYQTFIYPFMATYHITNPRYKAGAEFDFLLKYRHGIDNTNRCAEGFGSSDEFRVVQMRRKPPHWAPRHYFDVAADGRFRPVDDVARYRLLRAY